MRLNFSRKSKGSDNDTNKDMADTSDNLIINFYDPDIKGEDARHRTLDEILAWPDIMLERSHNYIQVLFPLPEGSPYNISAPIIDRGVYDAFRAREELRLRLRESFERILKFYGFEIQDSTTSTSESEDDTEAGATNVEQTDQELPSTEEPTDDSLDDSQAASSENASQQEPTGNPAAAGKDAAPTEEHPKSLLDTSSSPPKPLTVVRRAGWKTSFANWAHPMDHNHLRITRILRCLRVLGLEDECNAFYKALVDVYQDPRIKIFPRSMNYWTRANAQPLHIAPDGEESDWLKKVGRG
ncbi:hypothetical protein BU24DRAFT_427223 [Aaosphaeria arxii CBS 175.79]|uniref:Opioid growth factor receptor (OGFr) conserved domain-containing protein n=1 Tax=Aaosphaeria arxii CBS 175.79 TaxID=1450172 RepID=A0A6A5XDE0_9PLEO|nr:uncharacterized protein BU24DRAFT_427223 [Aaosphaeria arxii CBS 175.79]KAF2011022.1 hypothetical protein BU24DRAFT_427223 [Aaosphaeria arxii CBS 175.79]